MYIRICVYTHVMVVGLVIRSSSGQATQHNKSECFMALSAIFQNTRLLHCMCCPTVLCSDLRTIHKEQLQDSYPGQTDSQCCDTVNSRSRCLFAICGILEGGNVRLSSIFCCATLMLCANLFSTGNIACGRGGDLLHKEKVATCRMPPCRRSAGRGLLDDSRMHLTRLPV